MSDETGDIVALIVAIVGVVAALGSTIVAVLAQIAASRSATKADAAQKDAQAASERAAAASERMAMMQASVFNSPPWSIEWFAGDTHLLTNTSSVDAIDVVLSCSNDRAHMRYGMDEMPGTIGARSAVKVMAGMTMATPWVTDIVVTWRRPGDETAHTWRHPIPQRPDR